MQRSERIKVKLQSLIHFSQQTLISVKKFKEV